MVNKVAGTADVYEDRLGASGSLAKTSNDGFGQWHLPRGPNVNDNVMFFCKCRYLLGLGKVSMYDSINACDRSQVIINISVAQVDC